MEQAISVERITKKFSGDRGEPIEALAGVTLSVAAGEFFVLLGPSGSGKSTLLRIMSGLEAPSDGTVCYGPAIARADTNFVFQQFALLPWLTVAENVGLGLYSREPRAATRSRIVGHELVQFGLEKFARAYPRELSGGMRQRVGIARALATKPKVVFMDEPFSELDSFTAAELRKELLAIWQARRHTVVLVSHNIEEAIELADRIAILTPHPGRIERILSNSLPRPRQRRSAQFYRLEDELERLVKP